MKIQLLDGSYIEAKPVKWGKAQELKEALFWYVASLGAAEKDFEKAALKVLTLVLGKESMLVKDKAFRELLDSEAIVEIAKAGLGPTLGKFVSDTIANLPNLMGPAMASLAEGQMKEKQTKSTG